MQHTKYPVHKDSLSSGDSWNCSKIKQMITHLFFHPAVEKSFWQATDPVSHIYHVPLCAQLFRFKTCFLWCKIQLSIYFPIDGFPLRLGFFPSSHDKQSAFLVRLGKHKTSSWLHLRKGNLRLIKCPPAEELDRRQTTGFRNLSSSLVLHFSFCVTHTPDFYTVILSAIVRLMVRLTESVGPKVVI